MEQLVVTGFYASLLGILYIGLAINIIKLRYKYKVGINDGGHKSLAQAVRVHGNFAEYVPLVLILFACYELSSPNALFLHGLGAVFVLGRISHVIGLTKTVGVSFYRQFGMISTFLSIVILAIANIINFVTQ